jgi:hypothetical protein
LHIQDAGQKRRDDGREERIAHNERADFKLSPQHIHG